MSWVKKIKSWEIEPPDLLHPFNIFMGFDPGTVNMGVACTYRDAIRLYQIEFERSKDPVERMRNIALTLDYIRVGIDLISFPAHVVIENAGYGSSQFRQVELAEVRATIVWWLLKRNIEDIKLIAPNSIRKQVFGNGKKMAHEFWDNSEIPNDALAALSCLYYADAIKEE